MSIVTALWVGCGFLGHTVVRLVCPGDECVSASEGQKDHRVLGASGDGHGSPHSFCGIFWGGGTPVGTTGRFTKAKQSEDQWVGCVAL